MITAYGSEKIAVEAMKSGAYDYLSKPFEVDELRLVVERAFEHLALAEENRSPETPIGFRGPIRRHDRLQQGDA